jgi:hypothetical protein
MFVSEFPSVRAARRSRTDQSASTPSVGLELTDSELAALDALDVTDRADGAREGAWW